MTFPDCQETRDQQAAAADVLGAIDDLVENNRRRVEVLEEIARAIYQEWFVSFRFPGYETATFIDSPFGSMPEGWSVVLLRSLGEVVTGSTPSSKEPSHWGSVGDMPF